MKNIFIAFLQIILVGNGYSQTTSSVTIEGSLFDMIQAIPVVNSEVKFEINKALEITTFTDENGNYQISFENPENEDTTFEIILKLKNYTDVHFNLTTNSNDNFFLCHIKLTPALVCWDSFLPDPIFFTKNSCSIPDSTNQELTGLLREIRTVYWNHLLTNRLEISASASYSEARNIAQCRIDAIYKAAIELGFKTDDIIVNLINKDDLFICEFCDGCHYFFKKG